MNTTCSTIRKRLSAYLDRELDPRRQEEVRAHLDQCPACRHEYELLQRTMCLLPNWDAPAVDPQLSVRFAERLAVHQRRQPHWTSVFSTPWARAAWATGLAAVLVTLVFGVMQLPRQPHNAGQRMTNTPGAVPRVERFARGGTTSITGNALSSEKLADANVVPPRVTRPVGDTNEMGAVNGRAGVRQGITRSKTNNRTVVRNTQLSSRKGCSKDDGWMGKSDGGVSKGGPPSVTVELAPITPDVVSTAVATITEAPHPAVIGAETLVSTTGDIVAAVEAPERHLECLVVSLWGETD